MDPDFFSITPEEEASIRERIAEGRDIPTILMHARHSLRTARQGVEQAHPIIVQVPSDISPKDFLLLQKMPSELRPALIEASRLQQSGVQIAVAFGVATTMTVQNLRRKAPGFDEWWEVWRLQLRSDELARYFWTLRSVILKEGYLGVVMMKMQGGVADDGTLTGRLEAELFGVPAERNGESIEGLTTVELIELWLSTLQIIIEAAEDRWISPGTDRYPIFNERLDVSRSNADEFADGGATET